MDQSKKALTHRHPLIKSLTIRPYSGPSPIRVQMEQSSLQRPIPPPIRVQTAKRVIQPAFHVQDGQLCNNSTVQVQQLEHIQMFAMAEPPVAINPPTIPTTGRLSPVVGNATGSIMLPPHLMIRPVSSHFRVIQQFTRPEPIVTSFEIPASQGDTENAQMSMVEGFEGDPIAQLPQVVAGVESSEEPHVTLTKVTQNFDQYTQLHSPSGTISMETQELQNESSDTKLSDMVEEESEMDSADGSFITNEENLFEYEDCSSLIENAIKEPEDKKDTLSMLLEEWNIDKPDDDAEGVYNKTLPEGKARTLGWHIQQALERHHSNSGMKTLDIHNGLLSDSQSKENLIVRLNGEHIIQSLKHELKFVAEQSVLSSWRPAVRKDRLRSHIDPGVLPLKDSKRRRLSMSADLDIDEHGEYKRKKVQSLFCDEELLLESWDEQSLSTEEASEIDALKEERVLIPSPVHGFNYEGDLFANNDEDVPAIQPLKLAGMSEPATKGKRRYRKLKAPIEERFPLLKAEGKQMFNSVADIFEANRKKVRACFRPRTTDFGPATNGFDLLNWQSNVGVLWGSNLNFSINDLGLIDIITKYEDEEDMNGLPDYPRNGEADGQPHREEGDYQQRGEKCAMSISTFWDDYLEKTKSFAAPAYLFKHIRVLRHPVAKGMHIEMLNPVVADGTTVAATVVEVLGGRVGVQLHNHPRTFYYNDNSWELLPVGYSRRMDLTMKGDPIASKKQRSRYLNKDLLLQSALYVGLLQKGMYVEAFDWIDEWTSSILRPAVISRVLRDRVLVSFIERQGKGPSRYWCAHDSPLIRPVGYHKQAGIKIEAIKCTKDAILATSRELPTRSPRPFKVGMKLEAVDRVNPNLIRPATVLAVEAYELRICYDGFPEEYAFWVWDDSEDIFPIEWCAQNNHRLEPLDKDGECEVRFCNDAGHRNGLSRYHAYKVNCPYDFNRYFGGLQTNPNVAARCTRNPKFAIARKVGPPAEEKVVVRKNSLTEEIISSLEEKVAEQKKIIKSWNIVKDYGPKFKQNLALWEHHSNRLPVQTNGSSSKDNPMFWTCSQVKYFISQVPNCRYLGGLFEASRIDGEALLSLCESDLTDVMSLKLGLAIKIYNAIVVLRNRYLRDVVGLGARSSTEQ